MAGLCDSGLPEVKIAKKLQALQGTIKKGLSSPEIPSFQSACSLVAVRFALLMDLNHELVLNWIGYLVKVSLKYLSMFLLNCWLNLIFYCRIPEVERNGKASGLPISCYEFKELVFCLMSKLLKSHFCRFGKHKLTCVFCS